MPAPASKATTLFTRTGASGRNALSSLASRGKDRAADALLAMRDDIATQRALVRAWARDDISTSELARTLNRYDSLDASKQAQFRQLVLGGGDEVAAASARVSDDALQTVLEADVSTGTRVRALRTLDEVDSARADRVLDSIDSLGDRGQRNALEYLARTDSEGVELVAEFDQRTTRRFFEIDCGGTVGGSAGLLVAPTQTASGVALPPDVCNRDVFRRALKQSVSDNGNVDAADAADVVDEVFSLDGTKQQRAAVLVRRASGEGGAEFLADADGSTIDDVLSFEVDTADTDLQEQVRVSLVQSYSRNHFSLSATDSWADELYSVDDPSEVAGEIAQDIDTLDSGDGVDGEVQGLARTLSRDGDGGSGAYLEDLPDPDTSGSDNFDPASPVKGAALELRTARQAAEELDPGEEVRMSAAPDVDFDEDLSPTQKRDVAERIYGSRERNLDNILTSNPEFDAVQVVSKENGGQRLIYLESKNTKTRPTVGDVREQTTRFFAAQIANGADIENLEVTFITRTESQAAQLNSEIGADWFTARASSDSNG